MQVPIKPLWLNITRPNAGPVEKDLLYEIAAYQLATVISGVKVAKGVQTATGRNETHCSPLEVKFITEVTHSAEMLARSEADPLVKNSISLYKEGQQELKIGKRFDEVYDVDTLEPTKEWLATYQSVYEEISDMGVPLS